MYEALGRGVMSAGIPGALGRSKRRQLLLLAPSASCAAVA